MRRSMGFAVGGVGAFFHHKNAGKPGGQVGDLIVAGGVAVRRQRKVRVKGLLLGGLGGVVEPAAKQ